MRHRIFYFSKTYGTFDRHRCSAETETGVCPMLEKLSYVAFGFLVAVSFMLIGSLVDSSPTGLAKTGRLTGTVAPPDFLMERFG
jgi:hypothetical protein